MTHVEYFDTNGKLLKALGDAHDGHRIPPVGTVLDFHSCRAEVVASDQKTYGEDTVKVIVTCKVLQLR